MTPELVDMITEASQDLPEYSLPEGKAFGLLALHKAGVLGLAEMLDNFPKRFSRANRNEGHRRLVACLDQLRDKAEPSDRQQISRLVRSLSRKS